MKNSKSGKKWVEILKNNPTAADQCEWETLNGTIGKYCLNGNRNLPTVVLGKN